MQAFDGMQGCYFVRISYFAPGNAFGPPKGPRPS
jgi:hypothetical protein